MLTDSCRDSLAVSELSDPLASRYPLCHVLRSKGCASEYCCYSVVGCVWIKYVPPHHGLDTLPPGAPVVMVIRSSVLMRQCRVCSQWLWFDSAGGRH